MIARDRAMARHRMLSTIGLAREERVRPAHIPGMTSTPSTHTGRPARSGPPSHRPIARVRAGLRRRPGGPARGAAVLLCVVLLLAVGPAAGWADGVHVIPVDGPVLRGYDPPTEKWRAGHRGVDLGGIVDDVVHAAADGTVTFVGTINGVRMLTVTHEGSLRTTYQPVAATVAQGDHVMAGQQIGTLLAGHCPGQACLHLGLKRGDQYLDPLAWINGGGRGGDVSLLPADAAIHDVLPAWWVERLRQAAADAGGKAPGWPADGPVTSPFSNRINPILGTSELHDGLDIGAPCGSPVRAAWAGTISYAAPMSGFGNRVEVDHGEMEGRHRSSSYNHLADESVGLVHVGDHVEAGQVIAYVGTTGLSTGCHLHFSVYLDGSAVDPAPYLP